MWEFGELGGGNRAEGAGTITGTIYPFTPRDNRIMVVESQQTSHIFSVYTLAYKLYIPEHLHDGISHYSHI